MQALVRENCLHSAVRRPMIACLHWSRCAGDGCMVSASLAQLEFAGGVCRGLTWLLLDTCPELMASAAQDHVRALLLCTAAWGCNSVPLVIRCGRS